MRMRASWYGSFRPAGYKVAARACSCPDSGLPSHVIAKCEHGLSRSIAQAPIDQRAVVLGCVKAEPFGWPLKSGQP